MIPILWPDDVYHYGLHVYSNDPTTGWIVARADVTSHSLRFELGRLGPRGGWNPASVGGDLRALRELERHLADAVTFAMQIEAAWLAWREANGWT